MPDEAVKHYTVNTPTGTSC